MLLLFCRDRDAVKSNMVLIRSQIVQRASLVILLVWIIEILGSKLLAAAFISPKTTPSTRNHPSHHPEIMLSRFRPAAVALSTKCMYHLHRPTQSANISSSSTTLSMNFFRDIFRSLSVDGGAFNLQIDYEALPFPCPEIADMARQQHPNAKGAFVASPSMPHLYLGTFAGGCFWGLELFFQRVEGVEYTAVGYTQGRESEPNYEQVCAGATGHTEAVMVYYNPQIVSYQQLVEVFLDRIDPTTVNGQGKDYGRQYRTGIYTHSKEQVEIARELLTESQSNYTRPIATELRPAMPFWPAEAYHQQYLEKGGRFGSPQSAEKGCQDEIRCYG